MIVFYLYSERDSNSHATIGTWFLAKRVCIPPSEHVCEISITHWCNRLWFIFLTGRTGLFSMHIRPTICHALCRWRESNSQNRSRMFLRHMCLPVSPHLQCRDCSTTMYKTTIELQGEIRTPIHIPCANKGSRTHTPLGNAFWMHPVYQFQACWH